MRRVVGLLALQLLVAAPASAQVEKIQPQAATVASPVTFPQGSTIVETSVGVLSMPAVIFTVDGIGVLATPGVSLVNNTAATVGTNQYAPALSATFSGWKTNATAGAQAIICRAQWRSVTGAAAPSAQQVIECSINGGAFTTVGTFTSDGQWVTTAGSATVPFLAATGDLDTGLSWAGQGQWYFLSDATRSILFRSSEIRIKSNASFSWADAADVNGSPDTFLSRLSAGAVRMGAAADTFDIITAAWGTTKRAELVSTVNTNITFLGAAKSGTCDVSLVGDAAIYLLRGTANSVVLVAGDAGTFSITKATASRYNVFYDAAGASGAGYYAENLLGSTQAPAISCEGR